MKRAESLLTRPWLLVVVVALVIVLPLLVVGELSANDARARMRTAELGSLAGISDRAAASLAERIRSIADQVSAGSATPLSGRATPLLLSLERGDADGLGAFVSYLAQILDPQVLRIMVLDRSGAVVAVEPGDRNRLGHGPPNPASFTQVSRDSPTYISRVYMTLSEGGTQMDAGGGLTQTIAVSSFVGDVRGVRAGVVVAEIELRLLGTALTPLLGSADDVYLLDGDGRLLLRASHAFTPDDLAGRDLRGSSGFAAALSGRRTIEADDPLGGGERLIGVAPLATVGWTVLALRSPSAVETELEASLTQARAARIGLAAVLLVGTALLALSGRRVVAQSAALATASRHKSEFLANMSHELRTPLNAIIGFSDVLEQRMFGELNDRQTEYVRDIASSGRHLLDLVNEILDLSKVEAGRIELEPTEFALADTIHSALAFVRERAAHHGIELAAEIPGDLGTLVADERKVRQALLNLLSNAVKFTPDGGWIGVTARRRDGEIQVSVRDAGIGIAPQDQLKVFDEFQQVGKRSDRSREGTGLGLTLAKRFIELHGGHIWLESEVGKGTTFTFALPVGRTLAAPA